MKTKHKNILFIGLIVLFYFIIAHTNILLLDDFRWGTDRGLARLANNFDNYNGRYLGNSTIILMTRSYLAQILIPVIVNSGIVILIYKILHKKISLPIIMFFILTIPFEIYRQTYGWMSGFANYNTVIFFILSIIFLIEKKSINLKELSFLFISGFSVQLFLENVSAVNVVLTFLLLVFALFNKKYLKKAVTLFISNFLGTLVMFSNTAYSNTDHGRSLTNINFKIIPETFLTKWSELFFKNNIMLLLLLLFGVYLILNKKKISKYIIFPIPFYFLIRNQIDISWNNLPTKLIYIEGFLLLLFIIIVLYLVYQSDILTKIMKYRFYFFFLLAGLYSGPFLVIAINNKPFVQPRNVLTTYILLIIAILHLYLPFIKTKNYLQANINKYIILISISFMIILGSMASVNYLFNNKRIETAKEEIQAGQDNIKLEKIPFEKLHFPWSVNKKSDFMIDYKKYYDIPEHVEIEEVPLRNNFTN